MKSKNLSPLLGILLVTCCLQLAVINVLAQGTWTPKASLPGMTTRCTQVCFSIGTKGYMGTGYDELTNSALTDFWEYDPATNTWTQKADFAGGARIGAVGFAIGAKGYLGTGSTYNFATFFSDFWEYDPSTNAWTQIAAFGGGQRTLAAAFSIGNYGYVGTGDDQFAGDMQDMWQYDPSLDVWNQLNNFGGQARSDIDRAVFVIGNLAYMGTGYDPTLNPLSDFWSYDPSTDSWTKVPDVPGPARLGAVGFSLCDKGFVGMGYDAGNNFYTDLWMYDPGTNAWSAAASFPSSGRDDMPSFVINGTAYISAGETGFLVTVNDFWSYSFACLPPPVASFKSSDSVFCSGECITYTDLSSNATSWLWNFPGGTPASSTDENPTVCYYTAGTFDATLVASNSGGSDTLHVTNFIKVFASPPTPVITRSNDTLYCSTDPSYSSYQWYDSTVLVPGATKTYYVFNHSGNYNVQVTNENGCQIAVGINVVMGIDLFGADVIQFTVSPNPAENELRINTRDLIIEEMAVLNALGEIVFSRKPEARKPEAEITLNVSDLSRGIYFIQIKTEKGNFVQRFVKN